jgi:hybrid cluster-associated redox disulfide protein
MNTFLLDPTTTVKEVLDNLPETARTFIDRHMNCVGCHLTRFCTLAEVANIYEISIQILLYDLQQNSQSSQGNKNRII